MKLALGDDVEAGQLLLGGPGEPLASNSALAGAAGGAQQLASLPIGRASAVTAIAGASVGGGGSSGGGNRDRRGTVSRQ